MSGMMSAYRLAKSKKETALLRITRTTKDETVWLKLEGKIVGPWVEECRRAIEKESELGTLLALDLSDVTFVDSAGVAFLRETIRKGVETSAHSSFITELLKTEKSG